MRAGIRTLLGDPGGEIALSASTHDLVVRFLSTLDLRRRPRLVTTDGEFHTLRRQLARLSEGWLEIERVAARPVEGLAERLAAAVDERTSAVLVSAVLYEDASIVPALGALAPLGASRGVELLVDTYHALGVFPFQLAEPGLETAWIVGGGYKYLQLGEGNCYLRLPPHAYDSRPAITGWFADFGGLSRAPHPGAVAYPRGAAAFAGSTYDPTSNYRAARVFDFFVEQQLTAERLRDSYRHQVALLARCFDDLQLPETAITRDRASDLEHVAGFLALRAPHADQIQAALAEDGVLTDSRGETLRIGPAPYLSDEQLAEAMDRLGVVVRRQAV